MARTPEPSGKLELNWTNKNRSLLAHEDGTYEWVVRRDRRVAEVRLLRDAGTVGEVGASERRAEDNLLIRGDALHALTALADLPEFAATYEGKVKLCYIDPPFNTGQAFAHYDDGLEHSVWLTMMRDRLRLVKKLLRPDGSVWVHLDDSEVHRCRMVMDEEFGSEAFVATVVWQKRTTRENRAAFGSSHDSILIYAPMGASAWRHVRNLMPRTAAKEYRNPNKDPKGPWRPIPMDAQGHRPNQMYEITTPAGVVHTPPKGRCWSLLEENFKALLADGPQEPPSRLGRIYFGKDGKGRPNIIRYLSESEGLVPGTWWPAEEVGTNDEAKKHIMAMFPDVEAFDTPKPERLMQRIIQIGSNPGDVVLDCFAGSGTTAAVANKMRRRWVTSERSRNTIDTFTAPRLQKVVKGEDPGGITEAVEWHGGGGFRVLDVAPSMYEEDAGVVVLAEWATNGALAEAVAAQLGFAYEPDGPFAGRKGRMRLAVLDGHANAQLARTLVELLGADERLTLCATSLDADVTDALRRARSGSRVRVVPEDILISYATASPWRVSVANDLEDTEAADAAGAERDDQTDETETEAVA